MMNSLGLSIIMKSGCFFCRESIVINGVKYTVKERLGEGGFSTVDLVESHQTRMKYALKRITCHSADDQRAATDEIAYHRLLRHPNVVPLIDAAFVGTADVLADATAEAYLLLPYYRRGTLADTLNTRAYTRQHYDINDILRIFSDICGAVKHLHGMQPHAIAHRDLKTGNIALADTDPCNAILMDLGSCAVARVEVCGAQDAQRLQDIAAERCSMTYRAPELFQVESFCVIDQKTDIWSLGCVLYALCYFKSPFDLVYERGDSVNLAVLSGNIDWPTETPYSEEIHNLIRFMLVINPSDRPYIDDVITHLDQLKNTINNVV